MQKPEPILHNLSIDKLSLRLPKGMQRRAQSITRLLSNELRELDLFALGITGQCHIHSLSVPGVKINQGLSDRAIANKIACAITQQLRLEGQQEAAPCR